LCAIYSQQPISYSVILIQNRHTMHNSVEQFKYSTTAIVDLWNV